MSNSRELPGRDGGGFVENEHLGSVMSARESTLPLHPPTAWRIRAGRGGRRRKISMACSRAGRRPPSYSSSCAQGQAALPDVQHRLRGDDLAATAAEGQPMRVATSARIRVPARSVSDTHLARVGRDPAETARASRFTLPVGTDDDPMLARTRRPRDIGQDL